MHLHYSKINFLLIALLGYVSNVNALPAGFVYLNDIDPTISQEIKYYTNDNFVGRKIKGYDAPKCILTYKAALALLKLQKQLRHRGMGIKVYDCYRPSIAVDDFISWSNNLGDQRQKKKYYPSVNKSELFKLGYVSKKSGHSRGSTVDLTLIRFEGNHESVEFNMGTYFDYMDECSHPYNKKMTASVQHNRLFLRMMMVNAGFRPSGTEWWHFTLKNEMFPYTYFNFSVV